MYSVTPGVADAWRTLVAKAAHLADVTLEYVVHAAPAPLDTLWRREDLGCVLMCGFPWATWDDASSRPRLVGVPVPRGAPGGTYRSEIVARAPAPYRSLDDLRGARFGFTLPTSQSGYQAARVALAPLARGQRYFAHAVGPLVTPRAVVDALLAGDIDAGPLDSYWLALLRRHEPRVAAQLRTVHRTAWTAAPAFVCSAAVPDATATALRDGLAAALGALPALRDTLLLDDVVAADPQRYAALARAAHEADRAGYPILQ